MNHSARRAAPDLTDDRYGRPSGFLFRAANTLFRSRAQNQFAEQILAERPGDTVTGTILKAAVDPTALADNSLAYMAVADAAINLPCAAARLRKLGMNVTFDNFASVLVPWRTISAAHAGGFTAEGQPIRVGQFDVSGGVILHPYKFTVIIVLANELAEHSNSEVIVTYHLTDAWSLAYDLSVFNSNAMVAGTSPAGIFNGVADLGATAGGGIAALSGDMKKLMAALVAAGGGTNPTLVMNPLNAMNLKLLAGSKFDYPVLSSMAMAVDTIGLVEAGSFVSGFSAVPEFETSDASTLHMEDTTPLAIGTAGPPATVAAPTTSLWQINATAIKMHVRCSWNMRAPGHAQFLTGATW